MRRFSDGKLVGERIKGGGKSHTTNNQMELTATIKALNNVSRENPDPIILRSDSEYVVKGMNEWREGWIKRGWRNANRKPVANADLWQELIAEADGRNVTFEWVRGHAGDIGNEEVDKRAEAEAKKRA